MSQGPPLLQAKRQTNLPDTFGLPYVPAALILGVCTIIAGWLVGQNGRYNFFGQDRMYLLDSRTGDVFSPKTISNLEGPIVRFDEDGNWRYIKRN